MLDLQKIELDVLDFWKKNKIFDKLRKKNAKGKRWSFIDGPITANNPMGVHHAWGRTYKDLFQRWKAMQGYNQRFQNGFDCQGHWIEVEVEKEKGFKSIKDIEAFGIGKFVDACKDRTAKMAKLITEQSIRLGQWMDWENSYYTNSFDANDYKWWFIKYFHEKGWLYKGVDVVPWCPRCSAAQSKHALVTEGYEDRTDKAVYLKFPVKEKNKIVKNEFFLVWTTTPWTLPADVALAVNPNINYVKAKKDNEIFILAENLVEKTLGQGTKILGKMIGKDLEKMHYEMPYKDLDAQKSSIVSGTDKNEKTSAPHIVVLWDEVSSEDGTGIVHIAPGCGPEDYQLGKQYKLPAISPLDEQGNYIEGFGWLTGKYAVDANDLVIKDLEKRNFLFKVENYTHSYPHCTRCRTPVVFRLVPEWYISMKEIKQKLIEQNENVNWIPEQGHDYEQNWLENMGDWLFSRKRYYGLAMPIWECDNPKCKHIEVIGSAEELKKKAVKGIENFKEHRRPGVDKVFLKCPKCSGMMHRVVDTVDTWMDAAMIPFYTLDWLNNKKYFNEWFPAELVLECGPGQYRLWFFFMLLTGVTLTGKAPYKNVFTYELVKDIHGREMHKSWGNAIWFDEAVEKIGADLLRYVYIKHDPHQNLNFGFELADEPRRVLTILFNIGNYVKELPEFSKIKNQDLQIEDKWILSRLNHVVQDATKYMEDFKPDFYLKTIEDFFVTDLSRTYIQIIRERVQQDNKTKNAALYTLFNSYINILKLLAPTIPFLTENVYQELKKKFNLKEESLHLCDWTVADEKAIDEKLEKKFEQVRKVIEKALAIRVEKQTNIRWPLKKITIKVEEDIKDFSEVIKRQTNVKEIIIKKEKIAEPEVELDFSMNKEFEEEGYLREIIRVMQDARKKASLKKDQEIEMSINCDDFIKNIISKNEKNIKTVVNISLIKFLKTTKQKSQTKKKIKDHEIEVYF